MRPSLRVLFWVGIVAEVAIIGAVLTDNHLGLTHPVQPKSAWVDPAIHTTIVSTIINEPPRSVENSSDLNLVKQGMDLLRNGEVLKARQKFMTAFNNGEYLGAVGMAQSFDLAVLRMYRPKNGRRYASNKLRDMWQSRVNDMLQMTDELKRDLSAAKFGR